MPRRSPQCRTSSIRRLLRAGGRALLAERLKERGSQIYFFLRKGSDVTVVSIKVNGSPEEVAEALRLLAGMQQPAIVLEESHAERYEGARQAIEAMTTNDPSEATPPNEEAMSEVYCQREGCFNHLTIKQVASGGRFCGLSCAGRSRSGQGRSVVLASPKSDQRCEREGCETFLTVKQVKNGNRFCGQRCSALVNSPYTAIVKAKARELSLTEDGLRSGRLRSAKKGAKQSVPA